MKEETRIDGPYEFGERPKVNQNADSVQASKDKRALANKEIHEKGPLQALQEGLIGYKDYRNVRMARDLIELDSHVPVNQPEERGIWIWGDRRSGKSFAARTAYPDHYIKA